MTKPRSGPAFGGSGGGRSNFRSMNISGSDGGQGYQFKGNHGKGANETCAGSHAGNCHRCAQVAVDLNHEHTPSSRSYIETLFINPLKRICVAPLLELYGIHLGQGSPQPTSLMHCQASRESAHSMATSSRRVNLHQSTTACCSSERRSKISWMPSAGSRSSKAVRPSLAGSSTTIPALSKTRKQGR
jgi:hypothetical protein